MVRQVIIPVYLLFRPSVQNKHDIFHRTLLPYPLQTRKCKHSSRKRNKFFCASNQEKHSRSFQQLSIIAPSRRNLNRIKLYWKKSTNRLFREARFNICVLSEQVRLQWKLRSAITLWSNPGDLSPGICRKLGSCRDPRRISWDTNTEQ